MLRPSCGQTRRTSSSSPRPTSRVLPRLISSVRLSLGAAWLFVIAAEAITAEAGLGYRIFLVRRYLAMDVILPYVVWITFLAFAMDYTLRLAHDAIPWTRFREGG